MPDPEELRDGSQYRDGPDEHYVNDEADLQASYFDNLEIKEQDAAIQRLIDASRAKKKEIDDKFGGDWIPYMGVRGGRGWINRDTKEVKYESDM